jgi:hypothetical protein
MELALKLVAVALLVLLSPLQFRFTTRRPADRRRDLLTGAIGEHLTVIGASPVEGLVRRVSRRDVELRVTGAEVRIPLDQVREVWSGRRLLARW